MNTARAGKLSTTGTRATPDRIRWPVAARVNVLATPGANSMDGVSLAIGIGVGVIGTLVGIYLIFRDANPRLPW